MMTTVPTFSVVDMIAGGVLLVGAFVGFRRGLSGELAGLISLAVAVGVGWTYLDPVAQWLHESTRLGERGATTAAFVLLLAGAYVAMRLLRLALKSILEFSFKGGIERVGGGIAGLLKTFVVVSAVVFVLAIWPNDWLQRVFGEESWLGSTLCAHLKPVYEELSEEYPALRIPGAEGGGDVGAPSIFEEEEAKGLEE